MSPRSLYQDEKDHIKLSRALEPLVRSEGWRIYCGLIQGHCEIVRVRLTDPQSTRESDLADKGALKAMSLCLSLPESIIREAGNIVAQAGAESSPEIEDL